MISCSTSSNNKLLFIIVVTLTEGKRHDSGMLRMSGLLDQLQQFSHSLARQPLCIYGDPAYPLRIHLQAPYKAAHLTQDQEAFNSSMSDVRSAVEWVFGDILSYFAFLDFKENLKIGLSPIGTMNSVAHLEMLLHVFMVRLHLTILICSHQLSKSTFKFRQLMIEQ